MPGANAVLKRNLAKSKYPKVNRGTSRTTSATASTRLGGTSSTPGVGNVITNSTNQGRTKLERKGVR